MGFKASGRRAFLSVIVGQFFSSMADNALLIAAIGLLIERGSAEWMTPALRLFFYSTYVLLAAFAGAVADAWPKGRVMLATNLLKLAGCGLLIAHLHPLIAYALIGAGAAAHGPARYGILSELLPPDGLVRANAWMEVSTILSILAGVGLGSVLLDAGSSTRDLLATPALSACAVIAVFYFLSAVFTAAIPRVGAAHLPGLTAARSSLRKFHAAFFVLWRDREGQISLAVTSLFWAVSATLQFIILRWAGQVLQLPLSQAALLPCAVAIGMVGGALTAARLIPLQRALSVLPLGVGIGALVLLMTVVSNLWLACALLLATGVLSGIFLVPMNALLQARGNALMPPGLSIAVQSFNENLMSLVLLGVYGGLVYLDAPLLPTITGFGVLVGLSMLLILARQRVNLRARSSDRHQDQQQPQSRHDPARPVLGRIDDRVVVHLAASGHDPHAAGPVQQQRT